VQFASTAVKNDHLAYNRKCALFIKRKNEALDNYFKKTAPNNNASDYSFSRKYSDQVSNRDPSNKITSLEHSITEGINSIGNTFATEIAKLSHTLNQNITNSINQNNINVGFFIFNVLKETFEDKIPENKLINAVNKSFVTASLGNTPLFNHIICPKQSNNQPVNSTTNQYLSKLLQHAPT
jgi:uncharacterized membrane-anchored protein YjiN (DUF445 family)